MCCCFQGGSWGPSWCVLAGQRETPPICILLGRTLTLCVEEQAGGGIAYTCVWEPSWASAHEGFLLSGSDTGQRRFSHLGPDVLHMAHIPSPVTHAGAELPSPSSLLPVLQAVQPCTHRAHFPHVHTPLVGEFSQIVSSKEAIELKFGGIWLFAGTCHQSLALESGLL